VTWLTAKCDLRHMRAHACEEWDATGSKTQDSRIKKAVIRWDHRLLECKAATRSESILRPNRHYRARRVGEDPMCHVGQMGSPTDAFGGSEAKHD
jgi:hypothetical protein